MEEAQIKQIIERQPLHGSALLDPRCKILLLVCIGFVSYFLAGEVVSLVLMLVYGLFIALGNGGKWAVKMIVTYIIVLVHQMSSSMQSAIVTSQALTFLIASMSRLQTVISWLSNGQYVTSQITILMIFADIGENPCTDVCASIQIQIWHKASLFDTISLDFITCQVQSILVVPNTHSL